MDLMQRLPWRVYHDDEYIADYQQAVGKEVEILQAERDRLYLQFRPSTADWGMDNYEREYGLRTDRSKPYAQRLAMWRAKRRGRGTTTTEVIRRIASDLSQGEVEVVEYPELDFFRVIYTGRHSLPPDFNDLQEIIEEIKPAHLGYVVTIELLSSGNAHAAPIFHDISSETVRIVRHISDMSPPERTVHSGAGYQDITTETMRITERNRA